MNRIKFGKHENRQIALTSSHLQNGTGDANDIFKVVATNRAEGETIQTVSTKFKLIHYFQHCAVTTSGKQLPKWGFEQQETSCNPNLRDKSALWNVEDNYYEKCEYKVPRKMREVLSRTAERKSGWTEITKQKSAMHWMLP